MDTIRAIELLTERRNELHALATGEGLPEFATWRQKTRATLRTVYGPASDRVTEFERISFSPAIYPTTEAKEWEAFEDGRRHALGLLDGAIYEQELRSHEPVAEGTIDPDLWKSVQHLVAGEQWAQVASQSAIFMESRIRKWAGRPENEFGAALMTAVFKLEGGVFPLGRTDAEKKGWLNLALGFAGALGNVDRHRIQIRDDLKTYASGVLGTASLILTQLRHEHGNRFHD